MKFAMFYEIPVAKPWGPRSEYEAYQNTIEQAKLGDRMGFHSFWTVEHHFLDEYSHCSNPEVLYGHLSAVTKNLRLGYGVRLLPKPYNHPVRTAESVADARPRVGRPRRVRHRPLVDPRRDRGLRHRPARDARDVGRSARPHRRLLDERRVRVRGQALVDAAAGACTRSRSRIRTRRSGARRRASTVTTRSATRGIGLLSFTVGNPPEQLEERIAELPARPSRLQASRSASSATSTAATFTMVHCNDTNEKARAVAEESFVWYPKTAALSIASLAEWMAEGKPGARQLRLRGRGAQGQAVGHVRPPDHGLPLRQRRRASSATPTVASRSASATKRSAASCCSAC